MYERGDDVRTLMPGIALAETPEDIDLDRMSPFIMRAVAGRVRVALYEPGRRAFIRETARLPSRGRVALRRRRDRGDLALVLVRAGTLVAITALALLVVVARRAVR